MTNPIFPVLPTQLGIYSLTQLIGAREHSELYLATQSYVDRAVVIEVLRPDSVETEQVTFLESVRLNAAVTLPQVAPVLESASTGNLHYVIQEEPAGKPLQQLESRLNIDQAFSLVQGVAEVYCVCAEQGVAARPLLLQDIYIDGETFRFFSPVIAGETSDELRAEQMEQLAVVLEQVMEEQDVVKSNISIIIHWLRQGYGGAPMQWQPLAASLSTVRAARRQGQSRSIAQRIKALLGSPRARRQALRSMLRWAAFVLLLLGIVVGVACMGQLYEDKVTETRPALSDGYLHCVSEKAPLRVMAQPVSVGAYAEFMEAWSKMSQRERADLCAGMAGNEANASRMPFSWDMQWSAAQARREWDGFKMSLHAPVRGVSYNDALIYARYAKGELPSVDVVRTVRRHAGEPQISEWTSEIVPEQIPYEAYHVIYPDNGTKYLMESRDDHREGGCGFRIVIKAKN